MPSNLLGTLYTAMSGLNAFTRGLDNLSNNVANLNTTGYKANDVFYRELQGDSEFGIGGQSGALVHDGQGVAVAGTKVRFTDGELVETGVETDMAIDGNGLFVLRDGEDEYYTRAGEFTLDEQGFLVDPANGYRVAKLTDGGAIADINLREKLVSPAQATSQILLRGTLNRSAVEGTVYPPEGAPDTDRVAITLFDKNGRSYQVFARFTKQSDATWKVDLIDDKGVSLSDGALLDFGENGAPTTDSLSQKIALGNYDVVPVGQVAAKLPGLAEASIADTPGQLDQFGEIDIELDGAEFVLQPAAAETKLNFSRAVGLSLDAEGFLVDSDSQQRLAARNSDGSADFIDARIVRVSPASATAAVAFSGQLKLSTQPGSVYPPVTAGDDGNSTQPDPLLVSLFDQQGNRYEVTASFVLETADAEQVEFALVFNYGMTDEFRAEDRLVFVFDPDPVTGGRTGADEQRSTGVWVLQTTTSSATFVSSVAGNPFQLRFETAFDGLTAGKVTTSDVVAVQSGGREEGQVTSIAIDTSGQITVGYDNGDRREGPVLAVVDRQLAEVRLDFSAVNTAPFVSSAVEVESVDGRSTGQLIAFAFASDGRIVLAYSNGDEIEDGKVALALFSNLSALERAGDALFTVADRAQRILGSAESGAFGAIVHRSIERSNVELSREFAEIIIVQRGFQAASQVLNATNELIEELYSSTRGGR